jgi:2-oxoglutarate dehydrogenase E2 component (dihydrolipoamide succinyltransferase)
MARIEVVMPQMGESIAEGTIVKWHKKIGDQVKKDETLLEISTDKVDSEIPSPAAGVLAEIVVAEQTTVVVGTVIAFLETDAGAVVDVKPAPAAAPKTVVPGPAAAPAAPPVQVSAPAAVPAKGRFYSPLVLSIARSEGVSMEELERLPGTGEGGRVSKKDILAHVQARKSGAAPAGVPGGSATAAVAPPAVAFKPGAGDERIAMTNVQQKMAAHMLASVQTSPHVAAVHEVDMTNVVRHRAAHAMPFEKAEGFKLTYTPYIIDGVVRAIKKYPLINSSVDGTTVVRKHAINIGVAVASENGLIVPVIKHAEEKSLLGIARAVHDLAVRTRTKKLTADDISGGTFTISNYGVFGTVIGTPIINQPQIAILGTGAIVKRPVIIDDAIAIRSMAYFTMSFDHRVVDGLLGGMFLDAVVKNLEGFDVGEEIK